MNGLAGKKAFLLLILTGLLIFIVLFAYSSLNLKNIDYGYRLQELNQKERRLREEIDRLKAEKAKLFNLERVERIAREKLGYEYPQSGQVIQYRDGDHAR